MSRARCWMLLPVLFAVWTLAAADRVERKLDGGWQGQPSVAGISVLPDPAGWLPTKPTGFDNLTFPAGKKPDAATRKTFKGVWKKTRVEIPAAWRGRSIRLVIPPPLRKTDAVVFVNGVRCGDILRPGGDVAVTGSLRFCEPNDFLVFYTPDGTGTARGKTTVERWLHGTSAGAGQTPLLMVSDPAHIADVFANPSVRRKTLTLESAIVADRPGRAVFAAEILDESGRVVKTVRRELDLKTGETVIRPEIPWADPVFWELGAPYLYTCRARLENPAGEIDRFPEFRFGFREIRREGKELYMNGHKLHLRPCYSFGANRYGAKFLQDIGYNAVTWNHDTNAYPTFNPDRLTEYDQIGMGAFISAGSFNNVTGGKIHRDPAAAEAYRRYIRAFQRRVRNHPSIVACYVTQMIICDIDNFRPEKIGQVPGAGDNDRMIDKACEINREYNPNVLYYSHADGSNGDLSSGNLYLNWTPLQEREEWLSQWAEKGCYPWHGAEFGTPYNGCFWREKKFIATEHLARTFGDRAYAEEPLAGLENTLDMSVDNRGGHGCKNRNFSLFEDYPLLWDLRRLWVWRTNRAWRAFGLNGGNIYFNLDAAYGTPPQGGLYDRYGRIDAPVRGKPDWANRAYDIHQLGNRDFCGFIGGAPAHTDKTHAFFSGEPVEKQLVCIWDGPRPKTYDIGWRVESDGRRIAGGRRSETLQPGDIRFYPLRFTAPSTVGAGTKIIAEFRSGGKLEFTDEFPFEVFPKTNPKIAVSGEVALLDPTGTAAPMLRHFGIPFRKIGSVGELRNAKFLVLGKNALENADFDFSEQRIADGLAVLILPQSPTGWQSLGFKVSDTMARRVFLREPCVPEFRKLTEAHLREWRGAPDYGKPFGPVMTHFAQRGPRWTRNHTVAGLLLQTPERAGFRPLIDAGFDRNGSALLEFRRGTGNITFCTLDMENRIGSDPAAGTVAEAVLRRFFAPGVPAASRRIYAGSPTAQNLIRRLQFSESPLESAGIAVFDGNSRTPFAALRKMAESGKNVLVVANPKIAAEAGFHSADRTLYRVQSPSRECAVWAGLGPSLFRWRDALETPVFRVAAPGFTVVADGLGAVGKFGSGVIVFLNIPPDQLRDRYRQSPELERAIAAGREAEERFWTKLLSPLGGRLECDWWDVEAKQFLADLKNAKLSGPGRIQVAVNRKNRWETLQKRASDGGTVVIFDNPVLAQAAGIGVERGRFGAAAFGENSLTLPFPVAGYRFVKAPEHFRISPDGVFADAKIGKGRVVFCAIAPFDVSLRYPEFPDRAKAAAISTERILQLYARVLGNLGGEPATLLTRRLLTPAGSAAYSPLPSVHVLGPFDAGRDDSRVMLDTVFPGEDMAIRGDFNPNLRFKLPQGGETDWRPMLTADARGCFDPATLYPRTGWPVYYAICHFERKNAGEAILKFGVDWRGAIWCNGEPVFRTGNGAHFPKFEIKLKLKKGSNYLTFKLGSGRNGSKFWALLGNETGASTATRRSSGDLERIALYENLVPDFDPDTFIYW